MRHHTNRGYDSQLQRIRHALLRMSGQVEVMLADAATALATRNHALADQVETQDRTVDQYEGQIDDLCLATLARWHPVASDLRFIVLALKAVRDLERIGDLATHVATTSTALEHPQYPWTWDQATDMAQLTREMIHRAMDAMLQDDTDLAAAVIGQDAEVDRHYNQMFYNVLAGMQRNQVLVADGLHCLSVAKWLERAADHATNLAEYVIFASKGVDIRHSPPK